MMNNSKRDFIAEAVLDYDTMGQGEQGKMIIQLLEDQPVLMGFITNIADDFEDDQHDVLVDSVAILINAFISAGITVEMIPEEIVSEVIAEKVKSYETEEKESEEEDEEEELIDSPLVFEDLKTRAILKCNFIEEGSGAENFNMVLDTIIAMIERSIAIEIEKVEGKS